ncbi:hypothetical protein PR048_003992 [Dryococelus australis]|uniref:Uncharacterized protein n=1 Tax=Dryococelus australis TaxID=614101 RepID=A0ABQ9I4A0_9NEOP|nr:hypothetical protein PR048_003992 [Dryococelus australis]
MGADINFKDFVEVGACVGVCGQMTDTEIIDIVTHTANNNSSASESENGDGNLDGDIVQQPTKSAVAEALDVLSYFYNFSNACVSDLTSFQHVEILF